MLKIIKIYHRYRFRVFILRTDYFIKGLYISELDRKIYRYNYAEPMLNINTNLYKKRCITNRKIANKYPFCIEV